MCRVRKELRRTSFASAFPSLFDVEEIKEFRGCGRCGGPGVAKISTAFSTGLEPLRHLNRSGFWCRKLKEVRFRTCAHFAAARGLPDDCLHDFQILLKIIVDGRVDASSTWTVESSAG